MTKVLQQDLAGAAWLEKRYPTKRMPKWKPRIGSYRWEVYNTEFIGWESCMSAIFCRGSVEKVAASIASRFPGVCHYSDIASTVQTPDIQTLSAYNCPRDNSGDRFAWQWLPNSVVLFRLAGEEWTIVVGLLHPYPYDCGFPSDLYQFASTLHQSTGFDVVSASGRGSLELGFGRAENFTEYHYAWDDEGASTEWFEERGLFMPAYHCKMDSEGHFQFWLAEVPIHEVERIDLFYPPADARSSPLITGAD